MAARQKKQSEDPIPKDLFEILACPLCRSSLEYSKDKKGLVCTSCGEKFPIKNKIPVLLPK